MRMRWNREKMYAAILTSLTQNRIHWLDLMYTGNELSGSVVRKGYFDKPSNY
jgi:hypothetical protein